MAPSEHSITTFHVDVMLLGMYFLYCFEHFFEVNSKLIMHLLNTMNTYLSVINS